MIPEKKINFYVEPVEIEIYLKKAGKVRTIIKDLYVELIDVETRNEHSKKIFTYFKDKNEPIDLMEIMNVFPEYMRPIFESYYHNIELYENLSIHLKSAIASSKNALKHSLYFTELLLKYEPTVASTQFIGNFQTYNLNYLIRKLNRMGLKFLLEDSTVGFLIKRRKLAYQDKPRDREFEKLVELWEYNIKGKTI